MFGKKGSSAAGSVLVVLLMGLALALGVPQAAFAAEQSSTTELLASGAGYGTADGSGSVESLQRRLQALGESPGPVDGLYGPLTQGAVTRLQLRSGLAADGVVGPATRKALRTAQPRPLRRGAGYGVPGGSPQVKTLQRKLKAAGQRVGAIDGKFGPQTELAVNSLQAKSDLVVDGAAGPQTYAALDRFREDGSRQVKDEPKETERRGSAGTIPTERPEPAAPADGAGTQRARAKRAAATSAPEDGGGSDVLWILIAIGLGAVALAGVVFLFRGRLPRRKPPTSVIPLGRGLELEGESGDPEIGHFRGTAYAVEIPEVKDPGQRAEGSRFFVLDPRHRQPFWVGYSEVQTPLPPALQAHPGPWGGQPGLKPGAPVLGYVTVPRSVPERQAELYEQLARIEGLCKRRKFELLGVVRDVEPNGEDVLERPGVRYALERFDAKEARALVVCDVDRLAGSRPQLDTVLEQLDDRGVALVALEPELDTSTSEGRELVHQLEIVRSERAKLGKGRKAEPREQDAIEARVLELRDRGESLQAIADALNEDEVRPPGGFKWRPRSVRTVVERGDEEGTNVVAFKPRSNRARAGSPAEKGRREG